MRLTKILATVAVAAMTATSAMAGGLAPTPTPPTVIVPVEPAPAQRSSWGIILPILGVAALIALASSDDSE